jgi:hypothetical protein
MDPFGCITGKQIGKVGHGLLSDVLADVLVFVALC